MAPNGFQPTSDGLRPSSDALHQRWPPTYQRWPPFLRFSVRRRRRSFRGGDPLPNYDLSRYTLDVLAEQERRFE